MPKIFFFFFFFFSGRNFFFFFYRNHESFDLVKKCQETFGKRQNEWEKRVRIAALNCDFNMPKADVEKLVNDENLGLLEHFFFGEWTSEHNVWRNYGFFSTETEPPLAILVDREGFVEYTGNPKEIDLEQMLARLAKSEVLDADAQKKKSKHFSNLLSKKVVNLINHPDFDFLNYELSISWRKYKIYNENGQIVKRKLTVPFLSLKYSIKDTPKIKKLEEALYDLVGGSGFFKEKIEVINPKEGIKQWTDFLRVELYNNKIQEAEISFHYRQRFTFEKGNLILEERRNFNHENKISPQKASQVKQFMENLKSAHSNYKKYRSFIEPYDGFSYYESDRPIQLDYQIGKGDEFIAFPVENVKTGEKTVLKQIADEIIVISFVKKQWGEWNIEILDEHEKISQKNAANWQKKVRFICLNFGLQREVVLNLLEENKWNSVEFYIGEDQDWFNDVYKYAYSNEYPIIVDQKGKIACILENSSDRKSIESKIQTLINGNPIDIDEKNEVELPAVTKSEVKKLKNLLKDRNFGLEIDSIMKKEGHTFEFSILLHKELKFDGEMKLSETKYHNPSFSFRARKSDSKLLSPLFERIYAAVPKTKIKENFILEDTVDLKICSECNSCKQVLTALMPQYYCHFCKLSFCSKCGDTVDESKNGNEKLLHPHNMVWIDISDEKGLKEIDEYKLGKNLSFDKQEFGGSTCNICLQKIRDCYRFICLSCSPGPVRNGFVDLCQKCMQVLREKKPEEKHKEISADLQKGNHDERSHVWLRICFGESYNEY